jgi:hypothetical protein
LAALVLTAALGWSAYENTGFLFEYWNSQPVKIAQRNNLAFVSAWLRENVRDDEQVIGTAGRVSNALGVNDAQWLRGREIDGALEWDVETALRAWRPGAPTLLVVFSETDTMRTKEYLEEVFPGLRMEFAKDPLDTGGDVAWAHLTGPPENLRRFLTDFDCRGVQVAYLYRGGGPDDILMRVERVAPMISFSTFPSEAVSWFHRGVHPTRLLVQYRAVISIERVGKYRFWSSTYGGRLQLRIDGQALSGAGWIDLEAGPHRFEGDADFAPLAAGLRAQVFWHGPDTGGREELIPFYRIAEPDLSCVARRASVETDGDRTQIPPPPGRPSLP